ncbi:MAG: AMP-dependent synthetase/ligase [Promethearchaeota archaeon]
MKNKWNKYLVLNRFNNLAEMVLNTVSRFPEKIVMRWFSEDLSEVHSMVYKDLKDYMRNLFGGLYSLGLRKGDRIALCSETSHNWVISDLGVQSLGGVLVAVYPNLKPAEIKYILVDSDSKMIIVDTQENLEKVLKIEKECPDLKYIGVIEDFDESLKKENIFSLNELIEKGKNYLEKEENRNLFEENIKKIKEDDLASFIYTSGTTGIPKGTMLTHKNFLSDVTAAVAVAATLKKHIPPESMNFFTLLPLSHSFGRCVDEYCVLFIGATMNFVGGFEPKRVRKAFEVFRPTLVVSIPYFYQKVYNMILSEVKQMPPRMRNIFNSALEVGRKYLENKRDDKKNPLLLKLKYHTITKLVGRIVRKKLGGNIILMISGSAAIAPELVLFYLAFGINLVEGYGLTETSPVTHLLRTKDNSDYRPNFHKKVDIFKKLGTIGPPIEIPDNPYENIQQKLSEFGELLIKGPMVMKGYWKKSDLTKAAIDEEGWLHTGDLAEIDEDGYAKIVGRAKLVIKLLTAKMISPAAIENLIVPRSRLIAQFLLYGDDSRKYLTCIIVPYQEPLKKYADEHGIPYKSWRDIITNREILNLLKEEVYNLTKDVSEYARPKKFAISSKNFDLSEGYLTPSYKFKRQKLFKDLMDDINKMYESDDEFYIIESRMTDFYDQTGIIG